MPEERKGTGSVQIAIALIGLAGAIGAAWITAGAKFERDLDGKQDEIAQLRAELKVSEARLIEQQKQLDKKLAEIEQKRAQLDEVIETANASVRTLRAVVDSAEKLKSLGSGFLGGKKAAP